jgi:NinG protein
MAITKPRRIQTMRLVKKRGVYMNMPVKPLKRAKKGSPRVAKPKSISQLIKLCDKEFSIQVRMKGAWQEHGVWMNKDYTTNFIAPVKKLQCGHYLSRYYKAARWNFDNARPQSMMANMWMRGDLIRFRQNLLAEIGEARVLAVEKLRDAPIKLTRQFLEEKLQELLESTPRPAP